MWYKIINDSIFFLVSYLNLLILFNAFGIQITRAWLLRNLVKDYLIKRLKPVAVCVQFIFFYNDNNNYNINDVVIDLLKRNEFYLIS